MIIPQRSRGALSGIAKKRPYLRGALNLNINDLTTFICDLER